MPATLIYDRARLARNVGDLRARLPFARLFYAVKACGEPPVLAALAETGIGFEAASLEEVGHLRRLGVAPERIVCGLPMKGPSLIEALGAAGASAFAFDCAEEFAALVDRAPETPRLLRLYVHDLDRDSARWGMNLEEIDALLGIPEAAARLDGLSFHLARNYRKGLLTKVLDRVEAVLDRLPQDRPRILNIGGGYRIDLPPHLARKYDLAAFYDALHARIAALTHRFDLALWAEPGRAVVETAGTFCTPVLQVRYRDAHTIDAALELNIGLRAGAHPTEIVAEDSAGRRDVLYTVAMHLAPNTAPVTCNFLDAICEHEVFYRLPLTRTVAPGELLLFSSLGAYTSCLSSQFHQRPFPEIELV
jgi:ornithine decarboxylase